MTATSGTGGARILMTYGGWEGHQPRECSELFAGLLEGRGHRVTLEAGWSAYDDGDRLNTFDLIVQCVTMQTLSSEAEAHLLGAIAAGTGFAGWHGGVMDSFRGSPGYQFMLGGQFVAHPGNHRDYRVQIARQDHPITRGIGDFALHTEQYYLHVDPGNEVLASTVIDGSVHPWLEGTPMPVAWTRRWGAGKVYACALGHDLRDFEVPEARALVLGGLEWAAREK